MSIVNLWLTVFQSIAARQCNDSAKNCLSIDSRKATNPRTLPDAMPDNSQNLTPLTRYRVCLRARLATDQNKRSLATLDERLKMLRRVYSKVVYRLNFINR